MTTNAQTPTLGGKPSQLSTASFNGLKNFWIKLQNGAATTLRVFQTARMISTLANMTDSQLEQVGIERSEIPQYVEDMFAAQ